MKFIGKILFLLSLSFVAQVYGLDVNNETHSGSVNIQDPSTININNSTFSSTSSGEIRSETEIIINPDSLLDEGADILISAEGLTAYTITFVAGSNGSITGDLVQYVNISGSSTQVTAVPDSGYAFIGWSDGDPNPSKVISNPTANQNLTANFANVYTVTYVAGSNGSVMGDLSQNIISGGSTTVVYAIPDNGYKFVNWSDSNTDPLRVIDNVTANQTLTANFTATTGLTGLFINQTFSLSDVNLRTSVDEERYYPSGSALEVTEWSYQYDSLGNVSSAVKDHSTDPNKDLSFTYSFDDIGNRAISSENGVSKTYTTNDIQQYTTINENGTATNLTYDLSGNPDKIGDWDITWDGEDRAKIFDNSITGVKIELAYDFRGFRIWKKVFLNETLQEHIGYIYDGYLVTEEIDLLDNQKIIRSYTWGLDPAGTQQQVGGIGALVSMEEKQPDDSYKTYHYITDAGGNVTSLVESKADGSLAMADTIEYGPFGQIVASNVTTGNPYKFNTKYTDSETDLVYYGFRYYNPEDGRWLNRDPIGVNGGINIYNSVSNNMVNGYAGGRYLTRGMSIKPAEENFGLLLDAFGHEIEPYSDPANARIDRALNDKARRLLGIIAHQIIQAAHKHSYGSFYESWYDATISNMVKDITGKERAVSKRRPDIGMREDFFALFASKDFEKLRCDNVIMWEIKPDNKRQIANGAKQLIQYEKLLNRGFKLAGYQGKAKVSVLPFPPGNVNIRKIISVRYAPNGLILYKWNMELPDFKEQMVKLLNEAGQFNPQTIKDIGWVSDLEKSLDEALRPTAVQLYRHQLLKLLGNAVTLGAVKIPVSKLLPKGINATPPRVPDLVPVR